MSDARSDVPKVRRAVGAQEAGSGNMGLEVRDTEVVFEATDEILLRRQTLQSGMLSQVLQVLPRPCLQPSISLQPLLDLGSNTHLVSPSCPLLGRGLGSWGTPLLDWVVSQLSPVRRPQAQESNYENLNQMSPRTHRQPHVHHEDPLSQQNPLVHHEERRP